MLYLEKYHFYPSAILLVSLSILDNYLVSYVFPMFQIQAKVKIYFISHFSHYYASYIFNLMIYFG